jgi:hypothetical protein
VAKSFNIFFEEEDTKAHFPFDDVASSVSRSNASPIEPYVKDTTTAKRKNIEHALLVTRALGETLPASKESILSQKGKTKISIVISHCESPVDWIATYIGEKEFDVSEITIISKCGKDVEGSDSLKRLGGNIRIESLSNVGRCDHSYAHWIHENYSRFQNESLDDLIFFVKDNDYMSVHFRPFEDVFASASDVGFGCVMRPRCVVWKKKICQRHGALALHNKTTVEQVGMSQYDRTEREKNDNFVSRYTNLKDWRDNVGLVFPDSEYINVCYGGMFVTQKGGLLTQSENAWKNMESSLSRGDNIEEGHYAERSWASIVAPPPSDVPLDDLSSAVKSFVSRENNVRGMFGTLFVLRKSSFWKGLPEQIIQETFEKQIL